jgi:hypothetical protein
MRFIYISISLVNIINIDREDAVNEVNLLKEIINNYANKLNKEDNELYREAYRFLDMIKVLEIIQKIRTNRKFIVNIGLYFLFLIGVVLLCFNAIICLRNLKITFDGVVSIFYLE